MCLPWIVRREVLAIDFLNTKQSSDILFSQQDKSDSPTAIFSSLAGTYRCLNDGTFSLEDCGTALSSVVGYSSQEIKDMFHNNLLELTLPEDRPEFLQKVAQQLTVGNDVELACRLYRKGGGVIWVLNKAHRVVSENGSEYLCGVITDITRSRGFYDNLQKKLDQLNIILAQTENIIFEWDLISDSIFFSDTWERIFGYAPITQNFGKNVSGAMSHLHPDDVPLLAQHLRVLQDGSNYQATDARIARADGRYLWCRFRATAIYDSVGTPVKLVGIIINIDDEKRETSALKKQAERDPLTKLLNKQAATVKIKQYLNSSPTGTGCVLMIIDLDHFKYVNDQYGHMAGDSVLIQCAKEIKHLFRPIDVVARIGGDEFLVLMKDISDRKLVEQRCSQLISAFRGILQPYLQAHTLSCSIGASFSPEHGTSYYDLFVAADRALYHAKALGKNQYAFYNSTIASLHPTQFPSAVNDQIDSNEYLDFLSE